MIWQRVLDSTPKAQSIKGKHDKLYFIKIKNFYFSQSTIKEARIYNREKMVSSVNGTGETGQLDAK